MEVAEQTNGDFMRSIINVLREVRAYCICEIKTDFISKKKWAMRNENIWLLKQT